MTTEPILTLRDSLLPASEPEPSWWNQQFSSFRRATEQHRPRELKTAAKQAEQSVHFPPAPHSQRGLPANRQTQALRVTPQVGSPLTESAGFSRGLRARQMVQYTDSAVIKQELMDTSDEYFAELHRKHQMAEKKQKMIELDKMLQARNKLKGRIELLESTDDDVWRGHVERLLKKASRYTGDEVQTGHESDSSDHGISGQGTRGGKKQMTEDELAEKVYKLVLLAGIKLVKTKSIAQLREDLITEGKDLLEKYNKTLGLKSKGDQTSRNGQADLEKRARQVSLEEATDDIPETEIRKAGSKRSKRQRTETLQNSDDDSRSPSRDFEPLPVDAAARSDNESIYAESHQDASKKNRSEGKPSARRPAGTNTEKRASRSEKGATTDVFRTEAELFFPPVTASGEPVLLEAADKRMKIVEAEGAKKRTSTRALALPFGMPYPPITEWTIMYDLDGDFWGPYKQARLNGSFNLESVKAAEASGEAAMMLGIRQDTTSATITIQPPSTENGNEAPLPPQSQGNDILPPPPPIETNQPDIAPTTGTKPRILEPGSQDIVPDSELGDPDIVPSSWNTEDNAAASSGG
ncbi:hypothetical protein QFC21_004886 [Naganishia friedmannii]|uniref:Uncharacterized protein n=1 Tax=Naganishia friedmannii TaxID=89922 RepID=A0ACC2VF73_9TREE|nr:hypothetical protein QFC21_004886 [Naganishia friedmannii]